MVDTDLAGSALGGVEMLLKEILASKGHIKAIDHGDKKLVFSHGSHTACILMTSGYSEEFNYRLEMFHLSFEKQFYKILPEWNGDLNPFSKADDLIITHFLK